MKAAPRYSGRLTTLVLLMLCSALGALQAAATEPSQLSAQEKQMLTWIADRQDELVDTLTSHIDINTGTDNIAGIDQYRAMLAVDLNKLGFATTEHRSEPLSALSCAGGSVPIANHLVAKKQGSSPTRILLNGHMDTVFSADDEFQTLTVEDDGTLRGPGVGDMKGGIVIMLYALQALEASGRLQDASITVLLNSDEEIGSLGSRPLIEKLAREHDIGLIFEGSYDNRLTRQRKGLGQVRVKVNGRESHAGGAHEQGVSANLELAHKIIAIEALTDYERKTTVNVGVISGGEKRNTIPGCADAYIDLRYPTLKDGQYLATSIENIMAQPSTGNANYPEFPTLEFETHLHRPVKPATASVDELITIATKLSQLIGEPIIGTGYSGGGTDGSIAQAVGLANLDSIGADGNGFHSRREKTTLKSLIARAQLAAVMIGRLIDQQ